MPATMEGWRSPGGSSKEEQESGGTTGSGADTKEKDMVLSPVVAAGSKRQRRPNVRLGEIGDLNVAASRSDASSPVRWMSPLNFVTKKTQSGLARGAAKLPRIRPLANVTHRGEIGQVLGSPKVGTNDEVIPPPATVVLAGEEAEKEQEDEAAVEAPPSTSGRGGDGTITTTSAGYGNTRKGRPRKRKRAANIRPSTFAETIGVVALNRKDKELQKVAYIDTLAPAPAVSTADISEMRTEFAELSGTQAGMEADSGAARGGLAMGTVNNNNDENSEEEEHTQNGDTEVLEDDDGNGEDSSGRQEEDEPGSRPTVGDNQVTRTNETLEAPRNFPLPKDDHKDQCASRQTDGEKDRKNSQLIRESETPGGVRGWLSSLGLDKYSDLFEENEVDNEVLHLLTFEDLKDMGIVAVGARRKMFTAIQELGSTPLRGR